MPLDITLDDCQCPPGNHTDLENLSLILCCVECGQFSMAFSGSLDAAIAVLEKLRATRVYGTSVQHPDGHREVIGIRRAEAEAG